MLIRDLTLSFGNQDIFDDINLIIDSTAKVGIVGVNGAGKTTFFRVILGEVEPDRGEVVLDGNSRIGFLPQVIKDELSSDDISVLEYIKSGRPIDKINSDLQKIYELISTETDDNAIQTYFKKVEKLQQKLEYWDYYSSDSELLKIVDGMNIPSSLLDMKLLNLSGGQKSKVAFARLLYSKPEIILLDEPTNHLDKDTKDFVVNYLKGYRGGIFVISHDVEFLNSITNKILFLDKRTKKMELYDGNYDDFIKKHEAHEKALLNQAEIQNKEIEKLQAIVDKYANASGKRKKMAQDREKKLEKLMENKIDIAPRQKQVKIKMDIERESADIPLKIENLSFKYDKDAKKNIINSLSVDIYKGERFLIVGQNGAGKSTLLKLIVGYLSPDSGSIKIGNKTDIGYYAQEHELLNKEKTIIDNFTDINISQKKLRSVLGRFLFFNDDVYKKVGILSPGERSRVALAKLSLMGANMLLLDEPTNHLDPETQSIIAEAFKSYEGTMLIVSHNPNFVDSLNIERVLTLPNGDISYYDRDVVEHFHNINTKTKKYM